MADNAAFSGPKTEKGPPKWLMIGGALAGVAGLVVLVMRNTSGSSGQPTVSAGTSINAALGSLQEEQMNLLGTVQTAAAQNSANFSATSGQITDTSNALLQAIQDQGTSIQGQITGAINTINNNTNAGQAASTQTLMGQLASNFNDLMTSNNNLISLVQSESQATGATLGSIQSNVAATQQQMVSQLSAINSLIATGQQQGLQLNDIQNWSQAIGAKVDYNNALDQTWFSAISGQVQAGTGVAP